MSQQLLQIEGVKDGSAYHLGYCDKVQISTDEFQTRIDVDGELFAEKEGNGHWRIFRDGGKLYVHIRFELNELLENPLGPGNVLRERTSTVQHVHHHGAGAGSTLGL